MEDGRQYSRNRIWNPPEKEILDKFHAQYSYPRWNTDTNQLYTQPGAGQIPGPSSGIGPREGNQKVRILKRDDRDRLSSVHTNAHFVQPHPQDGNTVREHSMQSPVVYASNMPVWSNGFSGVGMVQKH